MSVLAVAADAVQDNTVTVAMIGAVSAVLVALVTTVARPLKHIRHQVQNDHTTNLREDIDALTAKVDMLLENQAGVITDIRQLRSDLNVERTERIALAERID